MVRSGGSPQGIQFAVLVADGFDQEDLSAAASVLDKQGARLDLLAPSELEMERGLQGYQANRPDRILRATRLIQDARSEHYQGLLIPGGLMGLERMKGSRLHVGFIQSFFDADKPILAMSHGPWLLTESGMIQGRTLTSRPTIRRDLERAGAIWKDQPVVVDGKLLSCRTADDVAALQETLVALLAGFGSESRTNVA